MLLFIGCYRDLTQRIAADRRERNHAIEPNSLAWLERAATWESFSELHGFVIDGARAARLADDKLWKLELVVEELVTNVIRHGYPPGESGVVRVGYSANLTGEFLVQIRSGGLAFNPLLKDSPDPIVDIAHRSVGGLGIYLVKSIIDEIDYNHSEGINIISFRIRI